MYVSTRWRFMETSPVTRGEPFWLLLSLKKNIRKNEIRPQPGRPSGKLFILERKKWLMIVLDSSLSPPKLPQKECTFCFWLTSQKNLNPVTKPEIDFFPLKKVYSSLDSRKLKLTKEWNVIEASYNYAISNSIDFWSNQTSNGVRLNGRLSYWHRKCVMPFLNLNNRI